MEGQTLKTSHGDIHVECIGSGDPEILLIHPNSSSLKLSSLILDDTKITSKHRVIAFDLPGHGKSSNVSDPERSYNLTAYAEVASEVLRQLKVNSVIVFGASLGGHVGYELVALATSIKDINIKGLMITGAPPSSGIVQLFESFNMDPENNITGNEVLTDEEVDMIICYGWGTEKSPMLEGMARRAGGRARKFMAECIKKEEVLTRERSLQR